MVMSLLLTKKIPYDAVLQHAATVLDDMSDTLAVQTLADAIADTNYSDSIVQKFLNCIVTLDFNPIREFALELAYIAIADPNAFYVIPKKDTKLKDIGRNWKDKKWRSVEYNGTYYVIENKLKTTYNTLNVVHEINRVGGLANILYIVAAQIVLYKEKVKK